MGIQAFEYDFVWDWDNKQARKSKKAMRNSVNNGDQERLFDNNNY